VALHRSQPDGLEIVSDANTLDTVLDAHDFDFDYEPGFDLSLISHGTSGVDLEARFLQVDDFDSQLSFVGPDFVQINNAVPIFITGLAPLAVGASYDSELFSGELNFRHAGYGGVTPFVGFRYLEIDETMGLAFDDGLGTVATYGVSSRNRLYGAQAGIEGATYLTRQLEIGFSAKGGVFSNNGDQGSRFEVQGLFGPDFLSAGGDSTSLLGEAQVSLVRYLTSGWALRASYGILTISDLALAPEQVPSTDFANLTASINNDNSIFYHGGFIGLELRR
jgi:hypothetical protein